LPVRGAAGTTEEDFMELGIRKQLSIGFDAALERVPALLKEEGFGILTEIDVKETLAKKLGLPFRRYRILGACNPVLAHEALQKNLGAGVMLPCNVAVYEDDDGKAVVTAVDPLQTAAVQAGPELAAFAGGVRERLARVMQRL
jgi:uncharacterized protein (DUF302 family)